MFADAFAAIATGFSGIAGGPFVDGRLKWTGTPTLGADGSITVPGTPIDIACKVQVDTATEAMRSDAEFQQRDVRLLILASGLSEIPDEAAHVEITSGVNAGTYALQTATRDPAGIGYECRARIVRLGEVEEEPGEPGQFDFSEPDNSGLLALLLEDA